jgi:hypothetical protein
MPKSTRRRPTVIEMLVVAIIVLVVLTILASVFTYPGSSDYTVVAVNGNLAVLEDDNGVRISARNPFAELKVGTVVTDVEFADDQGWTILQVQ